MPIRTDPGGVADPIQLMTLTVGTATPYAIKEFDETELDEHRQAIQEAETHMGKFGSEPSLQAPPEPPPTN